MTVRNFFAVLGTRAVAAPLELAQHLVLGAVDYARSLGFEPAVEADFADTRRHLGPWEGNWAPRRAGDLAAMRPPRTGGLPFGAAVARGAGQR
jgi:hypothetical protein